MLLTTNWPRSRADTVLRLGKSSLASTSSSGTSGHGRTITFSPRASPSRTNAVTTSQRTSSSP